MLFHLTNGTNNHRTPLHPTRCREIVGYESESKILSCLLEYVSFKSFSGNGSNREGSNNGIK